MQDNPIKWLRMRDIVQSRGRSRAAVYRDIQNGLFPPPVHLGGSSSFWPAYEIAAIDHSRLAGANDEAIKKLVAELMETRKRGALS